MNEDVHSKTSDLSNLTELRSALEEVRKELGKIIVGQEEVIEQLLVAVLAGGHALLVGVPGLAKTLLIRTLAKCFRLSFRRIQFTPDLMPSDITGTEVLYENKDTGAREFRFREGPLFANIVLADEINRTPPKTQAALLEAMQERQITVGGVQHMLPHPFFVLATQNPLEQEGTYPLPEAQLDRFMFQIRVDYPSETEELQIVMRHGATTKVEVEPKLDSVQILSFLELIRTLPIPELTAKYAVKLCRATRPSNADSPPFIKRNVVWGAGPRACQYLLDAAKVFAVFDGRAMVGPEDVRKALAPTLRHRLRLSFAAEADGIQFEQVLQELLQAVSVTPGVGNGPFKQVLRS